MNELNPIEQLTKTPEWIEVENIFKNKISELMDIRTISELLSPEETKIEIRARQIAIDKFIEFLKENNFSKLIKKIYLLHLHSVNNNTYFIKSLYHYT